MIKLRRSDRKLTLTHFNIDENGQRMKKNTGYKYMEQTRGTNDSEFGVF